MMLRNSYIAEKNFKLGSRQKRSAGLILKIICFKGNARFIISTLIFLILTAFCGCDSSKKAVDQVTGNQTVKQFEKSKGKINNIVEGHSDNLNGIGEDDPDEQSDDEVSEEDE
jgi:hypothetical protein